ncbi:MAG: methylated-DNA--[protein]-cysteine S-methyltransferase [Magnetococcales bacterium]|nr:methylated-DNA--[protein]-cysteine S-methyltransferase [Magnetococcales bacterium]
MTVVPSPLGSLWAKCDDQAILALSFRPLSLPLLESGSHPLTQSLYSWLNDYFSKRFQVPISFPLRPEGTEFQKRVWAGVAGIAAGRVATYGDLARQLKTSPRAVGQALGANPIPIVIPCHRIVAVGGRIGGYSGGEGEGTKRWLLCWEGID